MRIGALLFVGVGLFCAAACYQVDTSNDLACVSGGGVCLPLPDGGGAAAGCGEQIASLPCDPGYVCCSGAAPSAAPGSSPATDAAVLTATDAAHGG